jgi:hypothetical protein
VIRAHARDELGIDLDAMANPLQVSGGGGRERGPGCTCSAACAPMHSLPPACRPMCRLPPPSLPPSAPLPLPRLAAGLPGVHGGLHGGWGGQGAARGHTFPDTPPVQRGNRARTGLGTTARSRSPAPWRVRAGAAIPLLAGCFIAHELYRIIAVAAASVLGLAALGTTSSVLGGAKPIVGALRVVVGGAAAMAITYGVGRAFGAQGI